MSERNLCPVCDEPYSPGECGRTNALMPGQSYDSIAHVRVCYHHTAPEEYRDSFASDLERGEADYRHSDPLWIYVHTQSDIPDAGS